MSSSAQVFDELGEGGPLSRVHVDMVAVTDVLAVTLKLKKKKN